MNPRPQGGMGRPFSSDPLLTVPLLTDGAEGSRATRSHATATEIENSRTTAPATTTGYFNHRRTRPSRTVAAYGASSNSARAAVNMIPLRTIWRGQLRQGLPYVGRVHHLRVPSRPPGTGKSPIG